MDYPKFLEYVLSPGAVAGTASAMIPLNERPLT
jgi:hypothetical protein